MDMDVIHIIFLSTEGDADTWEAGAEIQRQVDKLAKDDKVEFFKLTKMKKLLDICDAFDREVVPESQVWHEAGR